MFGSHTASSRNAARPISSQSLRPRRAVERRAALEVEHAVLALPGRALAIAPVQLLPRVVVAGDVAALDAPHRARRLRRAANLPEHDEPCIGTTQRIRSSSDFRMHHITSDQVLLYKNRGAEASFVPAYPRGGR